MRTEFLCFFFCIESYIWNQGEVGWRKGALSTPLPMVVCSTDRSRALVSVLVLPCVALWFVLRGGLFCVLPCVVLFLCFSVLLALRLPRLGSVGRGANLSTFRTFVRFAFV